MIGFESIVKLKGKCALITGASRGIGRGIAEVFAGEPREIGTVAAFFASDEASYLTGQSIHVDGGWQGK
jgi:NAD(P)-dependent dehydrogenase (short-subunit alcohol dehydrogenase family)